MLGPDSERKNPLADRFDKNSRIFVTGGAGSIGRELIFQLVDYGARHVSIFDNSVERMNEVKKSIPQEYSKKIHLFLGDVSSSSDVTTAVSVAKPQCVFHLAALKHVDLAEREPYGTYDVNVEGTFNILKATAGVQRFMLMSTDKSVFPAGLMGATKRMAEIAVMLYAERYPFGDYSFVRWTYLLQVAHPQCL